jgi:hypothetical protein
VRVCAVLEGSRTLRVCVCLCARGGARGERTPADNARSIPAHRTAIWAYPCLLDAHGLEVSLGHGVVEGNHVHAEALGVVSHLGKGEKKHSGGCAPPQCRLRNQRTPPVGCGICNVALCFHWASQRLPRSSGCTPPYGTCLCYKIGQPHGVGNAPGGRCGHSQ